MKFFCVTSVLSCIGTVAINVKLEDLQVPVSVVAAPSMPGVAIPMLEFLSVRIESLDTKDTPTLVLPGNRPSAHPFQGRPVTSIFEGMSPVRFSACLFMIVMLIAALVFTPWRYLASRELAELEADSDPDVSAVLEVGTGSWCRTYRTANGEQRAALDLLFKCKIVSVQEFANSKASQEHIDECIWIAAQMLKERPVEEWVAWRQYALLSFEDSITKIFAARTQHPDDHPHFQAVLKAALTPPRTPLIQGALKDFLKLSFPTPPATRHGSNATTVQASPAATGRIPVLYTEACQESYAAEPDDLNITFERADASTAPRWSIEDDVFRTVPHIDKVPASAPLPQSRESDVFATVPHVGAVPASAPLPHRPGAGGVADFGRPQLFRPAAPVPRFSDQHR